MRASVIWLLSTAVSAVALGAGGAGQPKPKPDEKKDDKAAAGTPATPPAAAATPPSGDPDEPPKDAVADYQLLRALDKAGLATRTIAMSRPSLDDVFLRKTGRSLREDKAA